ncbi:acetate and sugar kinases/Hsc70/actin family protein [Roseomonas harenae]|uniref:hypothetical protein n=1 Tax=Muricoccus harenae TaxID=2692566 RepID=UPI0013312F9D|nr:hypothetical protein [Roseomonas harenae]
MTVKSPLLPPLRADHRVPPIPAAGVWHSLGSADQLTAIARGLKTTESLAAGNEIVSVPDVWAAVTVFHDALTGEQHPFHSRAVEEWRGLLATFALASAYVPGLTSTEMRLSDLAVGPWADIVRRLPPRAALLQGGTIDEVAIVRVDGRVIALAQPLTLLSPSRSLGDPGERPPVPWVVDGRFRDPLKIASLGTSDRWVLARFLSRVDEAMRPLATSPDVAALLGLIRAYMADAKPSGTEPAFEEEPAVTRLPSLPVFRAMNRREHVALTGKAASDCLLRLREGLGSHLNGVVLVDDEMDRLLGVSAGNLRVWGTVSLAMLRANPALLDGIRSDAQSKGYLIVSTGELFLPRLHRVDGIGGERGFDQHPAGAREHLLPLSPFLLALLDGPALGRACRLIAGGEGTTLHLALTLESGGTVTLSRLYPDEESLEPPLVLSVWPNFRASWWRLHLGFTSASVSIQFTPTGLLSKDGIRRRFEANDGFSAVAAARALLAGDVTAAGETTWLRDDRSEAQGIHQLPGPAEAAVLEYRRSDERQVAGLLLLPLPEPAPSAASGRATVGIDFGTTNTSVYLQLPGGETAPLRIAARHVAAYSDADQGRDLLDREFLPATDVGIPFQTILRVRRGLGRVDGERIFRDALIYFAQRRQSAIAHFGGTAEGLDFNLKWSREVDAPKRIELFLTEVALLALAEAGARGVQPGAVAFRFSFPEAFRPWQLTGFQQAARNAVRLAVETVTGERTRTDPPVEFRTESVSTALYFIHRRNVPPPEGLVSFDIGGGTTDVAVVQQRTLGAEPLAWRGSFELAGRALLIDHLRKHPAILRKLAGYQPELKALVDTLGEKLTLDDMKGILATELVVNSEPFATALDRYLPVLAGSPEAERLKAVALTGLAGLLDYTGRVVRSLVEAGRIEARRGTNVSLCLGGRASLLFRALLRSPEETDRVLRFFTDATGEAMPRANLVFSTEPKEEVAYGLVRDDASLLGRVAADPLLGEAVVSGANPIRPSARVADLAVSEPCRIEDAPEFRRFLNKLPSLGIRALTPEPVIGNLIGEANAEIQRAQTAALADVTAEGPVEDTSPIEPPFVVLLRRFVRRLAVDEMPLRLP